MWTSLEEECESREIKKVTQSDIPISAKVSILDRVGNKNLTNVSIVWDRCSYL